MTGKISKIRENIKKSYTSKGGELFVHGVSLENDTTEYESHQKGSTSRLKVGDNINYEIATDKYGNQKIKIIQDRLVAGSDPMPPQRMLPRETLPVSISPSNLLWLNVFGSICALKSGTATKLEDVIAGTDVIVKKLTT